MVKVKEIVRKTRFNRIVRGVKYKKHAGIKIYMSSLMEWVKVHLQHTGILIRSIFSPPILDFESANLNSLSPNIQIYGRVMPIKIRAANDLSWFLEWTSLQRANSIPNSANFSKLELYPNRNLTLGLDQDEIVGNLSPISKSTSTFLNIQE